MRGLRGCNRRIGLYTTMIHLYISNKLSVSPNRYVFRDNHRAVQHAHMTSVGGTRVSFTFWSAAGALVVCISCSNFCR